MLPPPIENILPGIYRHVTALFTTNKGGSQTLCIILCMEQFASISMAKTSRHFCPAYRSLYLCLMPGNSTIVIVIKHSSKGRS